MNSKNWFNRMAAMAGAMLTARMPKKAPEKPDVLSIAGDPYKMRVIRTKGAFGRPGWKWPFGTRPGPAKKKGIY